MAENESWVPIDGWRGLYEISNLGRVRRVKPSHGTFPGRVIAPGRMAVGYNLISLSRRPKVKHWFRLARLVAKAFLGPPPSKKHQINHKNGIKGDDRVENLEWCTPQENQRHRFDVLKKPNRRGEQHPKTFFAEEQVAIMKAMRKGGASNGSIAQQFDAKLITVKQITNGKHWGHVPAAASIPRQYKIGCLPNPLGSKHHMSKLTEDNVRFIRASTLSGVELAKRFSVSGTVITCVRKGHTWKHVS